MAGHKAMPKETGLMENVRLLREGYLYIMNRSEKFDSPVFETNLLGEKGICLTGKEAAELFYDNERFKREGAAPKLAQKTLFGEGGVQGLDGEEHRNRKVMFMSMMTKDSLEEVQALFQEKWERYSMKWEAEEEIVLYDEVKKMLAESAFEWTGVPLQGEDLEKWTDELSDMFEGAASFSLKHFESRRSRSKAEERMEALVEKVRSGGVNADEQRALYQFSFHKDTNGELLSPAVVAVELLNLLRPITAISVYADFTALAVHDYPEEAAKVKGGGKDEQQRFIQEVRRYYPFFPFAAARVKKDFEWKGFEFKKDTLTLLDLYGTNHHPDLWEQPDEFKPDRFLTWSGSPFDFIPQGGGEYNIGHRCAGEWLTLDILRVTVDYLVNHLEYTVPKQDLTYSMNDIPSLPESKMKIRDVRRRD
ncbi:cytochrome P450 [Rossellomorea vietnamensis]|uniref:Cytochrome P450 n=1 Tax=Rossellomorea vietnamensis TaxID=218284 RepID=A0A5D4KCD6_9BACI|nr:cytochrome P450 [Rossellomorea vietnamensis]TYR74325.1 cytochrome P450 [Rossellomorea vietnamensis]